MHRSIPICALVAFTAGCAATPYMDVADLDSDHVISQTAGVKHILVLNRASADHQFICSQSAPDATIDLEQASSMSIAVASFAPGASGSDEAKSISAEQAVEMAGRTPALLYTRELFFRVCETTYNLSLSKDEALDLFKSAIKSGETIMQQEAERSTVSVQSKSYEGVLPGLPAGPGQ